MTPPALDAVHRVSSTATLLVALDFDGTLAPTVDDPAAARALPSALAAIESLAKSADTVVAIVSGRPLGGLREVLTVPAEVVLVGSHGAESYVEGKETGPILTEQEHELLDAVCVAVEAVAAHIPDAHLERKPSGCALHTRLASSEDAEVARREASASVKALDTFGHVTERYGKDILEFLVRASNKGAALDWLRENASATAVIFIGDDVTDEDGFRVLTPADVGIKVGEGDTAAEFRIADPEEAVRLLAALAIAREAVVGHAPTSRTP